MKMKDEHLDVIRTAVQKADEDRRRQIYRDQGLSDKRYRWDLLWSSGMSKWVSDHLYPYLTDDHIDTALREIVPAL